MQLLQSRAILLKMRRTYSDAEKAQALDLYQTEGPAQAALATGIPKGTIAAWANRNGLQTDVLLKTTAATAVAAEQRHARREQLREEMLIRALDMLQRMDEPVVDFKGKDADEVTYPRPVPEGCKALATAAAILLDKFRLEVGEATSRHETTDDVSAEIRRLSAELAIGAP